MRNILVIQYGDYREAYRRFADGGAETYRDQKQSVDYVAGLAAEGRVTTVAYSPENYREELAPGLWAVGGRIEALRRADIAHIFEDAAPTHVLLRTPKLDFLTETLRRGIPVLPSFADIFSRGGPRTALGNFRLRRALLGCQAPCFANHSLSASRSLVDVLGLPPEKVVPWDRNKLSIAPEPRTRIADPARPTAFFAGMVTEEKGVGDCLQAIARLKQDGLRLDMRFAGQGDLEAWQTRARSLGIAEQVRFLGTIPNAQVRAEMRAHDFVIVPSRHTYAEGLPNTLCEGLAARAVLVVSDHPAFAGRFIRDEDVSVFAAGDPDALASNIRTLVQNQSLYRALSANAPQAHDKLYIGMEWTELVDSFLEDPENRQGWVEENCILRVG